MNKCIDNIKLSIRAIYQMIVMNISQYEKDKRNLIERSNSIGDPMCQYYTFKDLDTNEEFKLCEGLPACDILVELCKRGTNKKITIKELSNIITIFAGRYKILYLAKSKCMKDKSYIINDVSECAEKYFGFIEAVKEIESSE